MATITTVTSECDQCGTEDDVLTHEFSAGGVTYQIDLCKKHGLNFREVLDSFIMHARTVSKPRKRNSATRKHSAAVRRWWKDHPVEGERYSDGGRLPARVVAAYDATH